MTAKSNVIPALIHGVSQQDNDLRLPGHADAMTDFFCDPSVGAIYRPPMVLAKQLLVATPSDEPYTPPTTVVTSDGKRWGIVILDGIAYVHEVGTLNVSTFSASYLTATADSRDSIRSTQVGDAIVVANKEAVPVRDITDRYTGEEGLFDNLVTVDATLENAVFDLYLRTTGLTTKLSVTASATDSVNDVAKGLFDLGANRKSITFDIGSLAAVIGETITMTYTLNAWGGTVTVTAVHTVAGGDTYADVVQTFLDAVDVKYPNSNIVYTSSSTANDGTIEVYTYDTSAASYTLSTSFEVTSSVAITATPSTTTYPFVMFCRDNQLRILDVERTSSVDVGVTTSDTLGGTALLLQKQNVDNIETDPPSRAFIGMYLTEGVGQGTRDPLYFEYDGTLADEPVSAIVRGTWIETLKWGSSKSYDADSMPHRLLYNPTTGTWSFGACPWAEREVGDDDTVPFLDNGAQGLKDVFFFQGRLGFLYGNKWAFSKAKDEYNFFRETVIQVADADPILGFSSGNNTGPLFAAEEANQNLLLFGTNRCLAISGNLALTPSTINPGGVSGTVFNTKVKPQLKGSHVHFLSAGSNSNTYLLRSTGDDYKSTHISGHVDRYAPDCTMFAIAGERNIAAMSDGSTVVIHQWEIGQDGFTQNAFHKWSIPAGATIGNFYWDRDVLYMVLHRNDGVWITSIDCSRGYHIGALVRSDCAVTPASATYDVYDNETTITYTTPVYGSPIVYTTTASADRPKGDSATIISNTAYQVVVQGDWSGETLAVGTRYTPQVTLSELNFRDSQGMPYDSGRLQIQYLRCHYTDTAYLLSTVSSDLRPDRTAEFDQRQLVYGAAMLDTVSTASGSLKAPVRGANNEVTITLSAPGHLPVILTWIEWFGRLKVRGRRS